MKPSFLRKIFWTLSAEEPQVLQQCEPFIQHYFSWIGKVVFLIFITCIIGTTYAFSQFFDNSAIEFILGFFITCTITIIYHLLLFTLSKNVLKHTKVKAFEEKLTFIVRIWPILLFSILIAKPIEVMLFSSKIEVQLANYKNELILKNNIINKDSNDRIEYQRLIENSTFFVKKIELLNKHHKPVWFFTLIVFLLFLLPVIMKSKHQRMDRYFALKRNVFAHIIYDEYNLFETEYLLKINSQRDYVIKSEIKKWVENNFQESALQDLLKSINEKLKYRLIDKKSFDSRYLDSPFNTIPRVKKSLSSDSNAEFINDFYSL